MVISISVSPHGSELNPFFLLRISTADRELIPSQVKFLLSGSQDEPIIVNLGGAFANMGGISHPAINDWITQNNYHIYPIRIPTRLRFKLLRDWLVFIEVENKVA